MIPLLSSTLCPDWGPDNDRPDDRPLLSDEVRQWARKNPREASQLRERAKVKRYAQFFFKYIILTYSFSWLLFKSIRNRVFLKFFDLSKVLNFELNDITMT